LTAFAFAFDYLMAAHELQALLLQSLAVGGVLERAAEEPSSGPEGRRSLAGGKPKAPPPERKRAVNAPWKGAGSSPLKNHPAPRWGAVTLDRRLRWLRLRLATG